MFTFAKNNIPMNINKNMRAEPASPVTTTSAIGIIPCITSGMMFFSLLISSFTMSRW